MPWRHVAVRVAVGAARMEKHAARLEEQRARPVFLVRNNREVGDGAQLMTGYSWQRRNVARSQEAVASSATIKPRRRINEAIVPLCPRRPQVRSDAHG